MASTVPNLLTLPRELRDLIYSYLTHDIAVTVSYDSSDLPLVRSDRAFAVHVTDAPVPSVLRVHSRLHDEYQEAPCFSRPFRATIYIDGTLGSVYMPTPSLPEISTSRADALLCKANHVNIIIDCGDPGYQGVRRISLTGYWAFFRTFTRKFGNEAFPLLSLKIAARYKTNSYCAVAAAANL
jgi:hypothetical protein